jgi:signal transduction histidine kinase
MGLCADPLRPFNVASQHIVQDELDSKDGPLANEPSYQMSAVRQGRVVSLASNAMPEAGRRDDYCNASWRWNIRTNEMTWSNELYSIVGRDQNTVVPFFKAHFCFYTADSWVQLLSATLVLLNTGRPYELILQMLHADGTRRWVVTRGEAVRDQFGHVLEVCGTAEAIDEPRQVANEGGGLPTNVQAVREATGRLINAQDKESIKISRVLRDNVCQKVSLLAASIQDLSLTTPALCPQTHARLDELWRYTTGILIELDGISENLHSTSLDLLGFTFAVQSLCREFQTKSGILIECSCANGDLEKLVDRVGLTLFCVLKEALDNVARHSRATRCTVKLSHSSDEIVLRVLDNGVGFEPTELDAAASGMGFIRINERLFHIGGSLAVRSAPACGSSIEVRAPFDGARNLGKQCRDALDDLCKR